MAFTYAYAYGSACIEEDRSITVTDDMWNMSTEVWDITAMIWNYDY